MRQGTCVHFNGIQNEQCEAGLSMREVTGGDDFGWAKRMPCFKKNESDTECQQYAEPTDEQLKEFEAAMEKAIEDTLLVAPLCSKLRAQHPDGGVGMTECPVCKGKLHYSVAQCNGHVHGRCETEDCLRWME